MANIIGTLALIFEVHYWITKGGDLALILIVVLCLINYLILEISCLKITEEKKK